jgi:hypothetical protein
MDRDLRCDELLLPSGDAVDALIDRWAARQLADADASQVEAHLLLCTFCRDEAWLRRRVLDGIAAARRARQGLVERARVLLRWANGAMEALAGGLSPLPASGVTVRSGDASASLLSRTFAADALGAGALLVVRAAADSRFCISVDGGGGDGGAAGREADLEWVLRGADVRMIAGSEPRGPVIFDAVPAGAWVLEKRRGDVLLAAVDVEIQSP